MAQSTKSNWNRDHRNWNLRCECYKSGSGNGWYVHNFYTQAVRGPFKTLREAKFAAYEIIS